MLLVAPPVEELSAAQLVPGDLVMLEAGDRVPADVRLLRARGLGWPRAALLVGRCYAL
jgi:magnesium-transporting ATPase (P-type)